MQCMFSFFGVFGLSFARYRWYTLAEKKKMFQRFVQKDIRDKRGKEYVQRILLYVGGGVEEKVLTLMKASLKMLEPFLVSIKINE